MRRSSSLVLAVWLAGCAAEANLVRHASTPARIDVAPRTAEAPSPAADQSAASGAQMAPCELVEQHNLAVLRDASRRAKEALERHFPGKLDAKIATLEAQLDGAAADKGAHAQASALLSSLMSVQRSLREGEPVLGTPNSEEVSVEFCMADAHGAWAYWLASAVTAPTSSSLDSWGTARVMRLARVQNDGRVFFASAFPSYMSGPAAEEHFDHLVGYSNCCVLGDHQQGDTELLFINDQDGDGVAEIGLRTSQTDDAAEDAWSVIYRFKAERIEEREFRGVEVEDVDGDGRIDLLLYQLSVARACDYLYDEASPKYLGHALADGSYSFDDAAARTHLEEAGPESPQHVKNVEDVWCALAWGRPREAVLRDARSGCQRGLCVSKLDEACEVMENAAKEFRPPLSLDHATTGGSPIRLGAD